MYKRMRVPDDEELKRDLDKAYQEEVKKEAERYDEDLPQLKAYIQANLQDIAKQFARGKFVVCSTFNGVDFPKEAERFKDYLRDLGIHIEKNKSMYLLRRLP